MGAREERLGANEALFREVNERVAEVADKFLAGETPATVNFSCECGDLACTEQVAMTVDEYEAVRAKATQFAVAPGHEVPDIERVVARQPTYFVVEKQDPDAEEVARETDPRTYTPEARAAARRSMRLWKGEEAPRRRSLPSQLLLAQGAV